MWAEFYKIKMIDRASGYVDLDEDFQLEEEEDQDVEEEELVTGFYPKFKNPCLVLM